MEERVAKEATKLRQTTHAIGADLDKYLAGIELMEAIAVRFNGALPFPLYAYTSKGPYLLQQGGWERIFRSGAKILLKKRFGPQIERIIIQRDIDSYKESNSWHAWFGKHLYTVLITWGLLSAIVGALLGWLLCKFG
jgi:hypothetical protein